MTHHATFAMPHERQVGTGMRRWALTAPCLFDPDLSLLSFLPLFAASMIDDNPGPGFVLHPQLHLLIFERSLDGPAPVRIRIRISLISVRTLKR